MRGFFLLVGCLIAAACSTLDSTGPTRWCLNIGDTVGYVAWQDEAKVIRSCTWIVQKQTECFTDPQWTYTARDCVVGQKAGP